MILIPLIFIAIYLYLKRYKVLAFLLFFWFITSGFNVIPVQIFDMGVISKGSDFSFLMLVGFFAVDIFYIGVGKYLRKDSYTPYIWIFLAFLAICMLNSQFILHLSSSDIIKCSRNFCFLLAYFVFRNMTVEELERILKYLFVITTILCGIYLMQILIGDTFILNEGATATADVLGIRFVRFYNLPQCTEFFVVMAFFKNPFKGWAKTITAAILLAACLGTFHRSLIGCLFLVFLLSYVIQLPYSKKIKVFTISLSILIPAMIFAGHKFVTSRTFVDIKSVMSGDFADTEIDLNDFDESSTFAFRMGLMFERMLYLSENPESQLLGAGLLPEYSDDTDKKFNFIIGLSDENGRVVQIESADISYPALFLRIGYLGTALYLTIFIGMAIFFYKNRKNRYAHFSFLYIILLFGLSFFSPILSNPISFILPLITYTIISKQGENKKELNGTERI